ncbi:MFS transporter, partial [Klebsiella pneumoniae]|nr:MFS transporter [Klebsiella pneumoniae]
IKIVISCLSGSVLEWFDFAVYGFLAPIIASQFFPTGQLLSSILLTYSVYAIGFLVRPLGALFFGHIGDRSGRKKALVLSTLMMAVPTVLIG